MPKVSVIVPVYGVEKFIERCAVSLFEQTLNDIEYIFVDDCTPDKSIEILESIIENYRLRLAAENKTVRIGRMPTNSGQAAVRRHGIQLAIGDYIIHCDSDDWVDVDMYRVMYEKAVEGDYDMVVCDYFSSDGNNHIYVKEVNPADGRQLTSYILTKKTHSVLWNKLIKRTVYKTANIVYPSGNNGEDWAILSQLSLFIRNFTITDAPFYYYYKNPSSILGVTTKENIVRRFKDSWNNIKIVEEFFNRNNSLKKFSSEFDVLKIIEQNILLQYIEDSDVYEIRRMFSKELKSKPLFNPNLSLRDKLRYYSVNLKIYPCLKKYHLV